MAGRKSVNLCTHLERIIAKAGHKCWPRLFQNLRASCETDWVERYPAHAVAKWLGHSPKVAAEHYLMSREYHFEDVVSGEAGRALVDKARGRAEGRVACDANCDGMATRIASPQAAARDSARPHETTKPAATARVTAGSSEITPVVETGLVGSTGFEPVTSTV
jgi:hypothetical protein